MGKTAIILGATGLTGSLLLEKLVADSRYETIKLFSRKPTGSISPKVVEHIGDLLEFQQFKASFTGDEVYCCIGTTASKTKSKSIYKDIDFGIPVAAVTLCKVNNIKTILIISALGANSNSRIFYNKTKGEMENAILKNNIANTYILRPSLITGDRTKNRLGEKIGILLMKLIQPFLLGKLKKYRAIEASTIAQAMINLANKGFDTSILESDMIQKIGENRV
jgi:uncharacterized protein YbjT (DUF2867 family)